ncbi:poly [ADP-ribose] polymerase tankyrase-2 isoform X2 [Eupeodes corollae]|uniref:poly [ADP-ribose] polymerase tankyrase-2 isoform X2 n=1 Tax=Eupeodes corollae TaxID=290404 RepID=UPI002492C2B8|nr:poly [ADP-ribose] polymerase tankyrase-2 isoform X2 [Eupeodes corollae]
MSKFIADINERLFYYVSTGDLDNVIKLLLEGACATKKSSCGRTALGQAALKGHSEVLEVLLQSCEEGDTVFNSRTVARCSDMEIDYTPDGMDNLEWDDEIDFDSDSCTASEPDECSSLYLYYAKTFEQTGAILVNNNYGSKREDPHSVDALSRAPIHYAAAYGHTDCLSILLQHKSPVDITTAKGITPLHLAVNNEEIVRLLLNHRANPNRKTFTTGETALHIAIRQGNLQVVELLLQSGAYINEPNNREYTPLMCAIELDADEIAFSLVSKGAKLNQEDCNGHTALYLAVARNKVNLAGYLLQHGARLLISHYLLHKCVKHDYHEMARLLLAHGAGDNLNVRDLAGCTAIFLAIFSCNAEMLECLLENAKRRGVQPIDKSSNEMYYAVQYAESVQRFGRVARVLLAYGVPLNSSGTSCCTTPLTRAIVLKKLDIAEFLIKEGADVSIICTDHVADTLRVALRASYLNLLILLVHAGLNKSLFQPVTRHKPHWNAQRQDLESWITYQCRNPLSLQSLSRIQIRKLLIKNLDKQIANTNNHNESRLRMLIKQTGIPIPLQKYLAEFDDLPRI